jgi:hypothetical protein
MTKLAMAKAGLTRRGRQELLTQIAALEAELAAVRLALDASVALQSQYATLLNAYDGGARRTFEDAGAWLARVEAAQG